MRLTGKRALVTGAASGFGRGIAERFAAEGAQVAVLDLNGPGAASVAAEIGGTALPVTCDVADGASVTAAVEAAVAAFGGLDIIVNNAGWCYRNQPSLGVDFETFRKVFAVNVESIYHMTLAAVPVLQEAGGGSIINVSSTAGISPRPGLTWYNASKGAVNTMTQSLAAEYAGDNIRVNAIAPVLGRTGLTDTFMGGDTPEKRAKFLATIPMGRMSEPEDIAAAAVYLVEDGSNFMTGVILPVDGGRTI